MANPIGVCHLCGITARLSFEHVPPKAAFNDSSLLKASLTEWLSASADRSKMRSSQSRRGAGDYTLCERCNNQTGAWYVPAYVDWAYQGMRFARAGGSSLALPFYILPARIAKQIFCMFASANGKGFMAVNRELAKYVLDRDAVGIPNRFRLYCYLMSPESSSARQTGIVARNSGSKTEIFSEIAFRPFGYILTWDGNPPPQRELVDITYFTHHRWNEFRDLHIPFPMMEVNTYLPADFRSRAEWEAAQRKASWKAGDDATPADQSP